MGPGIRRAVGKLLNRQTSANVLYVLCSYDKALRCVAQRLLANPDLPKEDIAKTLRNILGNAVFNHYADLIARKDDPQRAANRSDINAEQHTAQVIASLEQQIRQGV